MTLNLPQRFHEVTKPERRTVNRLISQNMKTCPPKEYICIIEGLGFKLSIMKDFHEFKIEAKEDKISLKKGTIAYTISFM